MIPSPWKFLVRAESGRAPSIYRVDRYDRRPSNMHHAIYDRVGAVKCVPRESRAWRMRGGIAAIAESVQEALQLIEQLKI